MTALVSTDIQCDVCDKIIRCVQHKTRVQSTEARNVAIMYGWLIKPRQDLCPECARG